MGLGDALKRAGLVDDKDLRRAKRERKREEIASGLITKQESEQKLEAERRARHDAELARREEQRAHERAREEARRLDEARHRIGHIVGANDATERPSRFARPFYFVARGGKVRKLLVSDEMAARLSAGRVAIVERAEGDATEHAIVDRATAERIDAIDPAAVRFACWD